MVPALVRVQLEHARGRRIGGHRRPQVGGGLEGVRVEAAHLNGGKHAAANVGADVGGEHGVGDLDAGGDLFEPVAEHEAGLVILLVVGQGEQGFGEFGQRGAGGGDGRRQPRQPEGDVVDHAGHGRVELVDHVDPRGRGHQAAIEGGEHEHPLEGFRDRAAERLLVGQKQHRGRNHHRRHGREGGPGDDGGDGVEDIDQIHPAADGVDLIHAGVPPRLVGRGPTAAAGGRRRRWPNGGRGQRRPKQRPRPATGRRGRRPNLQTSGRLARPRRTTWNRLPGGTRAAAVRRRSQHRRRDRRSKHRERISNGADGRRGQYAAAASIAGGVRGESGLFPSRSTSSRGGSGWLS